MNFDNLNKWLTLLANIGVIAGIVFLSVELQQNNKLLESQARLNELEASTARIQVSLNNPELAHLNFKATSGENLTPEEENLYFDYALYTMRHWMWEYEEYIDGSLPLVSVGTWRRQASYSPVWRRAWESTMGREDSEFTQFVNENVFND